MNGNIYAMNKSVAVYRSKASRFLVIPTRISENVFIREVPLKTISQLTPLSPRNRLKYCSLFGKRD